MFYELLFLKPCHSLSFRLHFQCSFSHGKGQGPSISLSFPSLFVDSHFFHMYILKFVLLHGVVRSSKGHVMVMYFERFISGM